MRLSEEEMAREIRRAKRFNTIAFIVVLVLTAAIIVGGFALKKQVADSFLPAATFI